MAFPNPDSIDRGKIELLTGAFDQVPVETFPAGAREYIIQRLKSAPGIVLLGWSGFRPGSEDESAQGFAQVVEVQILARGVGTHHPAYAILTAIMNRVIGGRITVGDEFYWVNVTGGGYQNWYSEDGIWTYAISLELQPNLFF